LLPTTLASGLLVIVPEWTKRAIRKAGSILVWKDLLVRL
jgi:hypothetical protein